ncbi:MAG: hypothetical protein QNJ47_17485 [Nostocaceae cyanobacterium]|nr:hypothetical protein [Nostocaceae cyanobacterium]
MNILKIWDVIWDNTPFHYVIAIVLVLAICIELGATLFYCAKFFTTRKAIKWLRKWLKDTNSNTPNTPRNDKVRDWLRYCLGSYERNRLQRENNKYVLIKYPVILSRPVPRSSLRFVTTLCTAIGVL